MNFLVDRHRLHAQQHFLDERALVIDWNDDGNFHLDSVCSEIARAGHGDSARSRFGKPDSEIMIGYARIKRNQFARGVVHSIRPAFTGAGSTRRRPGAGFGASRIISSQRIPANHQQFQEHSYPILEDIHFGTCVMRPSHGNFATRNPCRFARNRISGSNPKRSIRCCFKNNSRALTSKRLETALSVGKFSPSYLASHAVKKPARPLAKCGLVNFDQASANAREPIAASKPFSRSAASSLSASSIGCG